MYQQNYYRRVEQTVRRHFLRENINEFLPDNSLKLKIKNNFYNSQGYLRTISSSPINLSLDLLAPWNRHYVH